MCPWPGLFAGLSALLFVLVLFGGNPREQGRLSLVQVATLFLQLVQNYKWMPCS